MTKCRLVSYTKGLNNETLEQIIMYAARVSNPSNQDSDDTRLLQYCIRNGHWSIFELADMTVEINTTRAISPQILRHKSFSFQEFSQRYADVGQLDSLTTIPEARLQDYKNRQNSNELQDLQLKKYWTEYVKSVNMKCEEAYKWALSKGIAKECARNILPLNSPTRLYMKGSIRSWIHYLQLRSGNGTQKEHQDIANEIKTIFSKVCPVIHDSIKWE